MGDVSIKMYDKQGLVLRIECTCNNIGDFRVNREVLHHDGTTSVEKAPLKKSIYSLFRLFTIMKSANYRYLEFVSSFDDYSDGEKKLTEVLQSVSTDGRSFKGINFFETRDLSVLSFPDGEPGKVERGGQSGHGDGHQRGAQPGDRHAHRKRGGGQRKR